jgi:hypothetical protein
MTRSAPARAAPAAPYTHADNDMILPTTARGEPSAARVRPGLPTVELWLSADRERVLIEVWDADERMPVRGQPDPDAEHGRGLLLVETLSEDWGTHRPAGYPGKIVWARCSAD